MMLAGILPAGIQSAEVFDGESDDGELFPEEAVLVAGAAAKRRREFTGVRVCARLALARAGVRPAPIMPGPSGSPLWPAGIVGSMTHCDGYRAAAVGRADTFAAIGIDAEPHEVLPGGVLRRVASDSERTALAGLAAMAPEFCWDRLLFSAKESVYKAWFPATGRQLGFSDAEVELDVSDRFAAHLLVPGPMVGGQPVGTYDGSWAVGRGLVVTAVAVPASCP
jgi:enterobactin synthetase component D / holo-[acyl-carrier protein] synthase